MTRPWRIARNAGLGLAGLIVVLLIATVIVVQTDWFRNFVRQKIITATEEGTGGRVEVSTFSFDPMKLEAVVTGFVIHGKEPSGAAPFVRAERVQLNLRLFTSLRRIVDVSFLGIERPGVNVLVLSDGSTNIPEPKDKKPKSDKTILDTVVDLAVDYFRITGGVLAFNSQKQPIDVQGRNLRADLWYNLITQTYKGKISMQPMYVVRGRNTPVVFTVDLPVVLDRNKIGFDNAKISTPLSSIVLNGSVENLNDPKTSLRLNGKLALADLKALGDLPLNLTAKNVPTTVEIDGNATVAADRINVNGLKVTAGASNIEASGTLRDPNGNGALQFKSRLALDEVGRLADVAQRPGGVVVANGTATLDKANNYHVTGNVEGRDLSFSQGSERVRNVNFDTAVDLDPKRLDLKGLRLSAFGGQFSGDASLEQFARYRVNGNLRNFDIQTAARVAGQKLPYDGVISGPVEASGDVTAANKVDVASARLSISPGRRGVPVSGRLNAEYNGRNGNISVANSYIALPNTRLNLAGSLNNRLNLELTTSNLDDLFVALLPGQKPPAALEGGRARFAGSVTGGLSSPHISGHLAVNNLSVQGRRFDSLEADIDAGKSRAALQNAVVRRGPMELTADASVGLQNWSAKPNQPVQAKAFVRNGDLADIMVLAGQPPAGYAGSLSASADVTGTVGNPIGTIDAAVVNGTLQQQPFDRLQARVNLSDQLVTVPGATLTSGAGQVRLTAEFRHPRESFTTGTVHANVQTNQIDLAQVRQLQQQRPNTAGIVNLTADVTGTLKASEFLLTSVNADASARNVRFDNQSYGDVTGKASTAGKTVNYNLSSNLAGADVQVTGNTQLVADYPTTASANFRNLPIEKLLAIARRTDVPARGNLSGTATFSGTAKNPQGSADIQLANANVYDEPIDRIHAKVTYAPQRIDLPLLEVVSGPSRIDLSGQYDHPLNTLTEGELRFKVNTSRIELGRIRNIQKMRPGLGGTFQLTASGDAGVKQGAATPVLLRNLSANAAATGITANNTNFGDLTFRAATTGGRLGFNLDSNLAGATIRGKGEAQLAGDYPVTADLALNNLTWTRLQPLLGSQTTQTPLFEAATDVTISVSGPVLKQEQLRGELRIPRLQVTTVPRAGSNIGIGRDRIITIHNEGPIVASLDRGVVRVTSGRLIGPQTNISLTGSAGLLDAKKALDLSVDANTNLALLQSFSRDIYSSGSIVLTGTVRGTLDKPLVNGRLDLQKASVNYVDLPNGLSNANGSVIFNGTTATFRNVTAESGGGKLTLTGFISYSNQLRLGVRGTLASVRVRTQQGVSVVASAFVNVTGTTANSLASGVVTVERITYAPQSDFGSILTRAGPPIQAASEPNPLLDNMRLDVRIRTSTSTAVQASLADNIQVDADLRLRGTAAQPSMLGRVLVTEGDLVFFGSRYRVSSGSVTFYNPTRIEPVLDLTLETNAKGVNVVLNVTGPIDNMKLNYSSDPPLQFQEIVGLLASGKTPTSDPTLLANQPTQPQQTFTQMGETALVSKAVADPVASRLERVFGVSQLKIDPTFTNGSELPQARVTLQQQVASNITFTYVSALQDPNAQIIRIEWSINPQWSAVANRDENGIFSINFTYKKQFR